jgi:hypothetical protein
MAKLGLAKFRARIIQTNCMPNSLRPKNRFELRLETFYDKLMDFEKSN